MNLRIGLIGCGEHSEIGHAIPLARYAATHAEAITLAAACDLRLERAQLFCQKFGFARSYQNADEMLGTEHLDVCIAVAPIERIADIGVKLLKANMPCVVEKPLGATIAEVQAIYDAAKTTTVSNMVSVNRRFMPLLNQGLEWARTMGPLRYLRSTMVRHARTEPDFLRSTAIHAMDTLRYIGGEIRASEIRVLASSTRSYAIDLQFENGIHGRIDVLPAVGVVEETYELFGDGFRVTVTSPFGPVRSLRCYQQNQLVLGEIAGSETPEDAIQGFYGEVLELVEAFNQKRRPKPSIEDVFPSVELCFRLSDSIKNHEP